MTPIEWMDEIREGELTKNKYGLAEHWDYFLSRYGREYTPEKLTYNIIYSNGKVTVAKLTYNNPKVFVTPSNHSFFNEDTLKFARVVSSIDNWLLEEELDIAAQMQLVIQDTYLYGTGILKVGYDSEYGYRKALAAGSLGDATITQFNPKEHDRIEYNSSIVAGMPWVLRVAPKDIVFPAEATSIKSCRWVAHRYFRHIKDLKADVKMKNIDQLRPNIKLNDTGSKEYVELWEIRDYKRGRMSIIATGYDKFLYDDVDELQIGGLPYAVLNLNDTGDSIWGIPDVSLIMAQQKELNEIRVQTTQYRRQARLRIIAEKNSLNKADVEKILSDEPVAFIEVDGNPNTAIKDLHFNIPSDLSNWGEIVRQDCREILGFSRVNLGELETGSRKTAYEVAQTTTGTEVRVGERANIVTALLKEVIKKVNNMIFTFWSEERIVNLVGEDGKVEWVKYAGTELKGDYIINIHPEEGLPSSSVQEKKNLSELYSFLASNPNIPPQELGKITARITELFPDIKLGGALTPVGAGVQEFPQGAPSINGGQDGNLSNILQGMR